MTTLPTSLPLLDPEPLASIWEIAPDRAAKLMGYFLEDLPNQMGDIEAALQQANTPRVGHIAHSLKSSSRQLGAMQLGEAAYAVEQAARSTPPSPQLSALVQHLRQLVPPTVKAINQNITSHVPQFMQDHLITR